MTTETTATTNPFAGLMVSRNAAKPAEKPAPAPKPAAKPGVQNATEIVDAKLVNATLHQVGSKILLSAILSSDIKPSSSQKNILVSMTAGGISLPGGVILNFSVYRSPDFQPDWTKIRAEVDGVKIEGNVLYLAFDLNDDLGPSSSGKTNLVASLRGTPVKGLGYNLNAYKKI